MQIGLHEENGMLCLTGFGRPFGLLKDSSGRLLVTDMNLHGVFRFSNNLGQIEWLGGSNDNWVSLGAVQRDQTFAQKTAVAPGRFNGPHSVCELESGLLAVLTYYTPRLFLLDRSGAARSEIGRGHLKGPATITLDSRGRLLVAEYASNSILAFEGRGAAIGCFLGGLGGGRDGFLSDASFSADQKQGAFDRPHMCREVPGGDLLVADTWNHRIQRFNSDGKWLGYFGKSAGGQPGEYCGPVAISVSPDGSVLITDWGNNRLQWFDNIGNLLSMEEGRGLSKPYDALAFEDQVVAADSENGRVLLWAR
ncbi:NHL repeat-containing protein [Hoeflea phototrophica]|nr:NHL repeat-containing protein [Hoeflea phototrophica]